MGKIKGITVKLHVKTYDGDDNFGNPIYTEELVDVADVLVTPTSAADSANAFAMYGKKTVYTLAIPKGDAHVWEDTEVEVFGHTFRTVGEATQGIEENIPLKWNKQIKVEFYG